MFVIRRSISRSSSPLRRQMLLAVATLLGQAPALGVVGADIFGNCLGIGELLAQAFKHQGLDSRARNLAAVAAHAALAECRALHAVRLPLPLRADRRHTGAAGSTAQQAGQGSDSLARLRGALVTAAGLNHLCCLERRVLNDRQVRRVDTAILVFAVRA